ncbi:pyruvate dehydrogenase (acetyl-transferring) E1 component subunit alpha [Peribacillus cavernae]|uniref:Pyruvate dehydrogenase E1 component subunit alpha n=1 Tax=Peribacillus cavernae TaxID=1674310 RepID=A0A3S0U682_9BACI|nr:pyruvate dehydrogenase (acetyl-transferring) E1 component subunit alpha [Peribacillus cavernae]MDQ0220640.1 pyruvate dehydrogenase E1 component alpha subunit [Peribacillus cavernae]RUQ31100.1 pyruvate dehydrogenase (acetyl-transferring) E1 component subunit alpha [Peribacillus cavernae]
MNWINESCVTVDMFQLLNEGGKLVGEKPDIPDDKLLQLYKQMIFSRVFDERALKLQRQGRIGTYAPFTGQEAAQVGSAAALDKGDWVFPSYREVAVSLVRGVPASQSLLYTMGHHSGSGDPDAHMFPVQIIIASQTLHAVGSAWASKYKKEKQVSVAYLGDGATSEGDFHEALNFAGVNSLPVIFFVQNNQWAISVPLSSQTASKSIAQKGIAYGLTSIQVDGNDVLAVYETMKKAVQLAKEGKPILIEAVTYRQGPHTTADDPTKYRTKEELSAWKQKDPLLRMKHYLIHNHLWNETQEEEETAIAEQKMTEAYQTAIQTPRSGLDDIFQNVYHKKTSNLEEQQNSSKRGEVSV